MKQEVSKYSLGETVRVVDYNDYQRMRCRLLVKLLRERVKVRVEDGEYWLQNGTLEQFQTCRRTVLWCLKVADRIEGEP